MALIEDLPSTNTPLSAAGLFNMIYPVGCVYTTTKSDFNPTTDFGIGTWEQIKDVFLLAAGDTYAIGATGGEATHTLTVDEMPSHTHQVNIGEKNNRTSLYWGSDVLAEGTAWGAKYSENRDAETENWFTACPTGGSTAHNNMPPYLTVYMWKRTA